MFLAVPHFFFFLFPLCAFYLWEQASNFGILSLFVDFGRNWKVFMFPLFVQEFVMNRQVFSSLMGHLLRLNEGHCCYVMIYHYIVLLDKQTTVFK